MKRKTTSLSVYFSILFLLLITSANGQKEELKLEILNGHSGGGVLAVAVSSDGKFALTGSTDQTALLWDLETGKQLRRFVGHEDAVSAVQFSKDGQFVLTASHDKTARLWQTATGKQFQIYTGHKDKILSAAISVGRQTRCHSRRRQNSANLGFGKRQTITPTRPLGKSKFNRLFARLGVASNRWGRQNRAGLLD